MRVPIDDVGDDLFRQFCFLLEIRPDRVGQFEILCQFNKPRKAGRNAANHRRQHFDMIIMFAGFLFAGRQRIKTFAWPVIDLRPKSVCRE
jgi:hypothetical protein